MPKALRETFGVGKVIEGAPFVRSLEGGRHAVGVPHRQQAAIEGVRQNEATLQEDGHFEGRRQVEELTSQWIKIPRRTRGGATWFVKQEPPRVVLVIDTDGLVLLFWKKSWWVVLVILHGLPKPLREILDEPKASIAQEVLLVSAKVCMRHRRSFEVPPTPRAEPEEASTVGDDVRMKHSDGGVFGPLARLAGRASPPGAVSQVLHVRNAFSAFKTPSEEAAEDPLVKEVEDAAAQGLCIPG